MVPELLDYLVHPSFQLLQVHRPPQEHQCLLGCQLDLVGPFHLFFLMALVFQADRSHPAEIRRETENVNKKSFSDFDRKYLKNDRVSHSRLWSSIALLDRKEKQFDQDFIFGDNPFRRVSICSGYNKP